MFLRDFQSQVVKGDIPAICKHTHTHTCKLTNLKQISFWSCIFNVSRDQWNNILLLQEEWHQILKQGWAERSTSKPSHSHSGFGYGLPVPVHTGLLMGQTGFFIAGLSGFTWQFKAPKASLTKEQGRIYMVFPFQRASPALLLLHPTHGGNHRNLYGFERNSCGPISQREEYHTHTMRTAGGMGAYCVISEKYRLPHTQDLESSFFVRASLRLQETISPVCLESSQCLGTDTRIALNQLLTGAGGYIFCLVCLPIGRILSCVVSTCPLWIEPNISSGDFPQYKLLSWTLPT